MGVSGIAGKVALVTGAARGIGAAYAEALASEGANVVVCDILAAEGKATADRLCAAGHKATFVQADVADHASISALMAQVVREFDGLDILVNNAAIWGELERRPIWEISLERWNRILAVNLTSVWLCSIAAAPLMASRGGGVVINQSSIGAYLAGGLTADYSTSKAGVNVLTKILAKTLCEFGIRVNAIAPGGIATEATLSKMAAEFDAAVARQCVRRRGTTDDLVGPLLFLASEASTFVAGQVLVVDGGMEMRG